jgi:hypothetical protein
MDGAHSQSQGRLREGAGLGGADSQSPGTFGTGAIRAWPLAARGRQRVGGPSVSGSGGRTDPACWQSPGSLRNSGRENRVYLALH